MFHGTTIFMLTLKEKVYLWWCRKISRYPQRSLCRNKCVYVYGIFHWDFSGSIYFFFLSSLLCLSLEAGQNKLNHWVSLHLGFLLSLIKGDLGWRFKKERKVRSRDMVPMPFLILGSLNFADSYLSSLYFSTVLFGFPTPKLDSYK